MTSPEAHASPDVAVAPDAPTPREQAASRVKRVLGVLVGLALIVAGTRILSGIGLAALAGMGAAAGLCRWRRRPLTRFAGWLGATLGVAVTIGGLMIFGITRMPAGQLDASRRAALQTQAQRRQHPPALDRWMRRYAPEAQPSPTIQAATDSLMASRPVFWWMMAVGTTIGALLVGVAFGSVMWAGATLALYGVLGRWPMAAARGPAPLRNART